MHEKEHKCLIIFSKVDLIFGTTFSVTLFVLIKSNLDTETRDRINGCSDFESIFLVSSSSA